MFVNKIIFLITISRHIKFGIAEMITDAKTSTLIQIVVNVSRVYKKREFHISTIHVDFQFNTIRIRGAVAELNVTLNPVSEDEHVPKAEIYIRTIRENSRYMQTMLPFKKIPGRITMEIVPSCVLWLNIYPREKGVSETMSPRTIITGLIIDPKIHCRIQFGGYVQTHEFHNNITGTEHKIGSLKLLPTGNEQGGYYFYILRIGRTKIAISAHHYPCQMM